MKFKNGTKARPLFSRKNAVGNLEVIKIYGKGFFITLTIMLLKNVIYGFFYKTINSPYLNV